jgi:hypothetical protein
MLKNNILECSYIISKFDKHADLKHEVLNLIGQSSAETIQAQIAEVDISRTDWNFSTEKTRKWVNYLFHDLMNHMLESYRELGFDSFKVHEIWFQQYYQNSQHGWHIHGSNFTNVYYLELSDGAPKTELISPFDKKTIITLDVTEGDTVVFPSFVLHRAPPNYIADRKTIVSFNTDVEYSDNLYGKNHAII